MRAAKTSLADAYDCCGDTVLLYQPRDTSPGSYVGSARLTDVLTLQGSRTLTLELSQAQRFFTPIPLAVDGVYFEPAILDASGDVRFHLLSPGLRIIEEEVFRKVLEHARGGEFTEGLQADLGLTEAGEHIRLEQREVRARAELRNRCLELYNWRCMVSGQRFDLPDGGSLLEASHFRALRYGGSDVLQNLGMKTRNLHGLYELGLFTIQSNRRILFADDFPPQFRGEFHGRDEVEFPKYKKHWPDEEFLDYHRNLIFRSRPARYFDD